ncbi:hypothetical protein XENTR_v10019786 [Xenopus tropicalis]|nr:hypothetical protein XENTR_v10019786 [Xenopus tropicalis]
MDSDLGTSFSPCSPKTYREPNWLKSVLYKGKYESKERIGCSVSEGTITFHSVPPGMGISGTSGRVPPCQIYVSMCRGYPQTRICQRCPL